MIRVTVEIVPRGIEEYKEVIGTMQVSNIGGDKEIGNYEALLESRGKDNIELKYKGHKRSEGVWKLIKEVLDHAIE